jgi:hypothetical protein
MVLVAALGFALEAALAEEAARSYQVWTASSAAKVFRDTAPPAPVSPLRLFAARREHEAVQIVIRAGEKPLPKVQATVSPWQGPGGAANLPTTLYRVEYVNLPAQKADVPDPLPPWSATDVPANSNQPVWLDVAVPPEAQPGEYKATVRVQPEGMEPTTVPLTLTVWNFTLPETPHLRTALGISGNFVAKAHGIEPSGAKYEALLAKYCEALLERRISAYSPPMDATQPAARKYLADPRCTGYLIPYSEDAAVLRRNVETLRTEGLLDKGYFYVVDEPVNKESYERLKAVCRKIHAVDPKLKIVAPYFRNCDFDSKSDIYALLTGYINIWCYNTGFYNGYPQEKQLIERRAAGDEAWSYVCCGPGKPFTNFFVEMDALAHRLLFWQQRLHRCSGFLYWSTTYWNPAITKDPWTDMATVKDINPNIYGDGSLFYPGAKIGVDGPVTSIRLENAREGLEDIEYLWLYEQKKGSEAVESLIRQVTTAWNQFTANPAEVEKARQSLAAGILGSP